MNTTKFIKSILAALLAMMVITANGQDYGYQCALQMTAQPAKNPSKIVLSWPARTDIKNYALQRKATGTSTLSVSNLVASSTGYTDSTAVAGINYEYKLIGYPLVTGNPTAYGSVMAGMEVAQVETRGGVLLVIASNIATGAAESIARFAGDLKADDWNVDQVTVSPSDTVTSVKAQIVSRYNAGALKSVVLLGHVPVPYSGNINPDSHVEHKGAWPCDGFYGDVESNLWTDATVNNATAARSENWNIPGDGKFDQNTFPSAVEMTVGRIDFANLPAFAPLGEVELMNRYLDKNHNFRFNGTQIARRGIVDDNLSYMTEALGAASRRAMVGNSGSTNMVDANFLTHGVPSLFGTGIGFGSYSSIEGVGTTADMAAGVVNSVFNHNFGSYYGDWNSTDNILRAEIAANGVSLTSMWSGRPVINLHRMIAGATVGECVQASMNQGTDAYLQIGYNLKSVHVSLMGDPTLRLHSVAPVSNVSVQINGSSASLSWTASPEQSIAGYHVYRAANVEGAFSRITTTPVTETSFTDATATAGNVYVVKALKLETSNSGSYFNTSLGVSAIQLAAAEDSVLTWKKQFFGTNAAALQEAGDFVDADKDGVCNLLEYAMGTNPLSASSKSGLENVSLKESRAGRNLSADFTLNDAATGAKVTIQCSADLKTWTTAPAATVIAASAGYTTMQVTIPASGERCFLRALVERK